MKFFIAELRYLVPLERVAEVVGRHREFLDQGYRRGWFLASGPKNPKTGGLIVARAPGLAELREFLASDPFAVEGIAEYSFAEFEPVKRHPEFGAFFAPEEEPAEGR